MQEIRQYLEKALKSFENDPADTRYQKGYQAAVENILEFVYTVENN